MRASRAEFEDKLEQEFGEESGQERCVQHNDPQGVLLKVNDKSFNDYVRPIKIEIPL